MFADADLIGAPIRVVVSPRNLKNNAVEITTRDKSINTTVDVSKALESVLELRNKLFDELNK